MSGLRILCVSDEFPWPPSSGYRIRLATILEGLAEAGAVDLFCSISERPDVAEGDHAPPSGLARLHVHHRNSYRASGRGISRWLVTGLPRAIAWIDWRGADAALRRWAPRTYDLVWYAHCHAWAGVPRPPGEPTVVDFDNLEDQKLRSLLMLRELRRQDGTNHASPSARLGELFDRRDVGRWRHLQHRVAESSRNVVVCSELDRARLGVSNAVVVPNGYDSEPFSRTRGDVPSFVMIGLMTYPPNEDGARYFATQVLPLIREHAPDAVFRIVGRDDGKLADLDGLAGVARVGEVDDVRDELRSATAVVVPLRAGSGTRVKILEAFAAGLPVVSTTLGCEGLDLRAGVELLVGDTPRALADSCLMLHREPATAERLAAAGHACWELRYRSTVVRARVTELARAAAAV